MCLASAIGDESEAQRWLGEWVFLCCRADLAPRVLWLTDTLIHRMSTYTSSSTSPIANRYRNGNSNGGSSGEETMDSNPYYTILKQLVVPAIEASGQMQGLLGQLKSVLL